MMYSMTGYGKAETETHLVTIQVEVRSLNSKNMDISLRFPPDYKALELEIRKLVNILLLRGKVDVSITIKKNKSKENATFLNREVIKSYLEDLKEISSVDENILFPIAVSLPGSIEKNMAEVSDEKIPLLEITEKAIKEVNSFRKREGEILQQEILMRISNIDILQEEIKNLDVKRLDNIRDRLESKTSELRENLDKNRFEQELIYYLEKLDISEEKVRLKAHLDYFVKTALEERICGKKLGFISQEIGREINTIGSKANHVDIQKKVVEMKDELEKIKEQLLNIL